MKPRIAFVAKRKSGKSTAADLLIEHGFERIALAGPLKDATVEVVNAFLTNQGDDRRITRQELDANKAVFRPALEWLGTPFGRDYLGTPDRWIRQFEQRLNCTDAPVVCDDMRLPNEADELRAMGFRIVKIVRPESDRIAALLDAGEPTGVMPSEQYIDDIRPDRLIHNVGTVGFLRAQVLQLIKESR